MRNLDGHINRVLEGKTIEYAAKDGQMLILHMTNGEEFRIAWVNHETAEGYLGEPCLVRVDVKLVVPGVGASGRVNI